MTSAIRYEDDIIAWAMEQAHLLRTGRLDRLDTEHLAEEIEDVGKSEQRELVSRMTRLLAHLLKWQQQPGRRGASWQITIRNQRRSITRRLKETPSLRPGLAEPDWWAGVWDEPRPKRPKKPASPIFRKSAPGTRIKS